MTCKTTNSGGLSCGKLKQKIIKIVIDFENSCVIMGISTTNERSIYANTNQISTIKAFGAGEIHQWAEVMWIAIR